MNVIKKSMFAALCAAGLIVGAATTASATVDVGQPETYQRVASGVSLTGGKVYKSNGYAYNAFTLKDSAADGNCVYVTSKWYSWESPALGQPLSWVYIESDKTSVCGSGNIAAVKLHRGDPHRATRQMKVVVDVCVELNNRADSCQFFQTQIAY